MKFTLFLIILFILLKQVSAECYEPIDIFSEGYEVKKVNCGKWVNQKDKILNADDNQKLVGDNETMFQIDFTCLIEDKVLCGKVQNTFNKAGKTISDTLKLKEKLFINATLLNICEGNAFCPLRRAIGATKPNRLYSLLDDDGLERLYPQALVKQFQFPEHPKYDDYDVTIFFNAMIPFHFDDDINPISPLQFEFEYIVTHELIHGLGFFSAWQPYNDPPTALLPSIAVINGGVDGNVEPTDDEPFTVKESIFNKFMIRLDNGTFTSEYTKIIGQYFLDNINVTTINVSEFEQTYQFQIMKEMLTLATTPKSLGFLPHNSNNYSADAVILETALSTFRSGSSLSHVDLTTYNDTSDYLMVYKGTPGRTLQDFVRIGGNYPGGVIGPKTKAILETIGYATNDYPDPYKPQPFVKSQPDNNNSYPSPYKSSASSVSSSAIFNQFYMMMFIIIILL